MIVVAAMAASGLVLSIRNATGARLDGLMRPPRVRVRIHRRGVDFSAEIIPVDLDAATVADHGVAWLDSRNLAHSGDPLWFSEAPRVSPLRINFVSRTDTRRSPVSVERDREIEVGPAEGVAAWFRWELSTTSGTILVLWSAGRREKGQPPEILRDASADAWVSSFQGHAPPPAAPSSLQRLRRWMQRNAKESGESVTNYFEALHVSGLRGFGREETLRLSIPDGKAGSGLTVVVGANNSGKSSIIEAFDAVYRATRQSAVSFAADRRHGGDGHEVKIRLDRADGRSIGVETLRAGTSEARAIWDRDPASTERIALDASVLPSRRQFSVYFGRYGEADRGWASSGSNEFSRSQNRDAFVARLFALHQDDRRLAAFNGLLREVTGRSLTWSIDLGAQQQYFLRFSEPGGGSHTSDGLGDGLISLLFILDALHDSSPSSLIVIDEPELSLHPQYVSRLALMLARFAQDRQIVIATHSPTLIDWSYIQNGASVVRVFKNEGRSVIAQPQRATLEAVAKTQLSNRHNPHVFGPKGNEVFFQEDGLLVLEGQEDVIYLPAVLDSAGVALHGSVFGWGAGGAQHVRTVLLLLEELGFTKVAVLLDGDEQALEEATGLESEFPGYFITSHPADDIRSKKAQAEKPSKRGLLTNDGTSIRPEYLAVTESALRSIDAYLQGGTAQFTD